jgi:competence protein ComGC
MDFSDLNLPIPDNIHKQTPDVQKNIYEYFISMDNMQKTAYLIAYHHLGSSFNVLKSNGYNEWLQSKKD